MLSKLVNRTKKGFTLVELLIVVAIIGILSTVGIPAFRKMMQKAKQSEARVNLGNLYTVESAFFSEYGAYGHNLSVMGYEISGDAGSLTYAIGFTAAPACTGQANLPAVGDAYGQAINASLPSYFATYVAATDSIHGRRTYTNCEVASTVGASPYGTFTAGAYGTVRQGVDKNGTGAGGPGNIDVWTVNQARTIANVQSGVQ